MRLKENLGVLVYYMPQSSSSDFLHERRLVADSLQYQVPPVVAASPRNIPLRTLCAGPNIPNNLEDNFIRDQTNHYPYRYCKSSKQHTHCPLGGLVKTPHGKGSATEEDDHDLATDDDDLNADEPSIA